MVGLLTRQPATYRNKLLINRPTNCRCWRSWARRCMQVHGDDEWILHLRDGYLMQAIDMGEQQRATDLSGSRTMMVEEFRRMCV